MCNYVGCDKCGNNSGGIAKIIVAINTINTKHVFGEVKIYKRLCRVCRRRMKGGIYEGNINQNQNNRPWNCISC